jgi:hypothetical protein
MDMADIDEQDPATASIVSQLREVLDSDRPLDQVTMVVNAVKLATDADDVRVGILNVLSPIARRAARKIADDAYRHSLHTRGPGPARSALRRLSRGGLRPLVEWTTAPDVTPPWRDTRFGERPGWRKRSATIGDQEAFAVDYMCCQRCLCGWVESPYTPDEFRRCGLASAALKALRADYPGQSWHTLGGHFRSSEPFWTVVGADVSGGYTQQPLCRHVER